ncbi:MAG: DUF3046 domain-containing protein [Actinomycetaceae bacterium]|nr:DUF3046 domain-containing protein [Actinomycetaceae bacterium]
MRESEFWAAVEWAFPHGRGRSLVDDLYMSSLGGKTPAQALDEGVAPQQVWIHMCQALDLPDSYHYIHRKKPEERDI